MTGKVGKGKNHRLTTDPSIRRYNTGNKLNRWEKEELLNQIIEWISEDYSKSEIRDMILQKEKDFSPQNAYTAIENANLRLAEISQPEAAVVVSQHTGHYEKIYKYLLDVGHIKGSNRALSAKEKLVGLHKDKSRVVINEKKTTIIERKVEYDDKKLNLEEQKRMLELIKKMN